MKKILEITFSGKAPHNLRLYIMNRELSEVRHIKKALRGELELTLDNSIGRNCGRLATMGK